MNYFAFPMDCKHPEYHVNLLKLLKSRYFEGGGLMKHKDVLVLDVNNTKDTALFVFLEHSTDLTRHYVLNLKSSLANLIKTGNDMFKELDSMGFNNLVFIRWRKLPNLDSSTTNSREINLTDYARLILECDHVETEHVISNRKIAIFESMFIHNILKVVLGMRTDYLYGVILAFKIDGVRKEIHTDDGMSYNECYEKILNELMSYKIVTRKTVELTLIYILDICLFVDINRKIKN